MSTKFPDRLEQIDGALAVFGFDLDETTRRATDNYDQADDGVTHYYSTSVTCDNASGNKTVHGEQFADHGFCFLIDYEVRTSAKPFALNGLLNEYRAVVKSPFEEEPNIAIDVINTPRGINTALRALGREPGKDVFEVVRIPDSAKFKYGSWLYGFADKQVHVADVSSWGTAHHDVAVDDHIQSWIAMPPALCQNMANRAEQLITTYRDQITLPAGLRPDAITHFLSEADYLSLITRGWFLSLVEAETGGYSPAYSADIIVASLQRYVNNHQFGVSVSASPTFEKRLKAFQSLGISNIDTDDVHYRVEAQVDRIQNQFIAQIAHLLIAAEELNPREDTEEGKMKLDLWHAIIKETRAA